MCGFALKVVGDFVQPVALADQPVQRVAQRSPKVNLLAPTRR
jgi:hypothetical protein